VASVRGIFEPRAFLRARRSAPNPSQPSPVASVRNQSKFESYLRVLKKSLALVYYISSVKTIVMQVLTEYRRAAEMLRTIRVMRVVYLFGAGCCRRDN
jgi:hypothetical protein